jgi:hypothetical protein
MNLGRAVGQIAPGKLPADLEGNRRLDSWLRINPDGTVEVFTGKVELGQETLPRWRRSLQRSSTLGSSDRMRPLRPLILPMRVIPLEAA